MNQQQLIDKIEAATNGKVEEFEVMGKIGDKTRVGFYISNEIPISSYHLLGFTDSFTFGLIVDRIYICFTTTLLD